MVFYKELAAWLLHGVLIDKYHEFFIGNAEPTTLPVTITDSTVDDDLEVGGVTGRQLNKILVSLRI